MAKGVNDMYEDPRYKQIVMGGGPPGLGMSFGFGMPQAPNMGSALSQIAMQQFGSRSPQPVIPSFGAPPAPPQGGASLGDRLLGGIQGGLGKGLEFLGGNDGANGLQLGSLLMGMYDSHQQTKRYDEEKRRRDELEDEQRRRYDANAPIRADVFNRVMGRTS